MLACYGSRYISLRFKTLLQPRGPRLRSVRAHVHPEVPLTERRQRVRRPPVQYASLGAAILSALRCHLVTSIDLEVLVIYKNMRP